MQHSNLDIVLMILLWLMIGWIMLRHVYKAAHVSIIMTNASGLKKTAILMEVLSVVFWPVGSLVIVPIAYIVLRVLKTRNNRK